MRQLLPKNEDQQETALLWLFDASDKSFCPYNSSGIIANIWNVNQQDFAVFNMDWCVTHLKSLINSSLLLLSFNLQEYLQLIFFKNSKLLSSQNWQSGVTKRQPCPQRNICTNLVPSTRAIPEPPFSPAQYLYTNFNKNWIEPRGVLKILSNILERAFWENS